MIATLRVSEAATIQVRRGSKVLLTRAVKGGIVKLRLSRKLIGTARSLTIVGSDGLGNEMPTAVQVQRAEVAARRSGARRPGAAGLRSALADLGAFARAHSRQARLPAAPTQTLAFASR